MLTCTPDCCSLQVRALPDVGHESETAAIYGMAGQLPDRSLIDEVTHLYLDACYARPPPIVDDAAAQKSTLPYPVD